MKLLRGDWPLRLASVALAAGLWFVIAGRQTAERGLAVPVELRNVPRDIELTEEAVRTVDVRLRASPGLIDTLDPGKVLAIVDLAGAHEGEKIVQLTPDRIQVPFGFRVVKITPSLLTLRLESTRQKTVPVRPRVVGRPAAGLRGGRGGERAGGGARRGAAQQRAGGRERLHRARLGGRRRPHGARRGSTSASTTRSCGSRARARCGSRSRLREVRETRVFDDLPVVARGGPARIEPVARGGGALRPGGPAAVLRRRRPPPLRRGARRRRGARARLRLAVELAEGGGLAVVETRPAEVLVRPLRPSAAALSGTRGGRGAIRNRAHPSGGGLLDADARAWHDRCSAPTGSAASPTCTR